MSYGVPPTTLGLLLGFAGVGMLYAEQLGTENTTTPHGAYGILILIAGCISWARFALCQIPFVGRRSGEWAETDFGSISSTAWLSLGYLGSLLAYSAYVWLLKVRPATEVAPMHTSIRS